MLFICDIYSIISVVFDATFSVAADSLPQYTAAGY